MLGAGSQAVGFPLVIMITWHNWHTNTGRAAPVDHALYEHFYGTMESVDLAAIRLN